MTENRKKHLFLILKLTAAILIPILIALPIAIGILRLTGSTERQIPYADKTVYDHVFVAALGDKYERLCGTKEPKIAVIGGSSVAFGLDSNLLCAYTGREVVNFGLYATLGSKIMLDLSEDGLYRGDIAVFAPELDARTLSLYFGADAAWQAIDATHSLYAPLARRNGTELDAAKAAFAESKKEDLGNGEINPSGVYNRKNFTVRGDVIYDRAYNTMALGYDPNTLFTLSEDLLSDEFLSYFNDYCRRMEARGVTVCFSFCPINRLALADGVGAEQIAAFESALREKLVCPVISSLSDYILNWGYFYDTNLHLNQAGVTVRTRQLIRDLTAVTDVRPADTIALPDAPGFGEREPIDVDDDGQSSRLFLYEAETLPDGSIAGYRITGVSREGMLADIEDLTLPSVYEGKPVIRLSGNVLSDLTGLRVLRIGKSYRYLDDAAFAGCGKLTDVYLDFGPEHCTVTTPGGDNTDGLMRGAPSAMRFHCPEETRADYQGDYTWGHYYKYFA